MGNDKKSFLNIPDHQYENFFGKMGYGLLMGGMIGLIATRSNMGRSLWLTFGSGFGAGMGFMDYRLSQAGLDYRKYSYEVPELPFDTNTLFNNETTTNTTTKSE